MTKNNQSKADSGWCSRVRAKAGHAERASAFNKLSFQKKDLPFNWRTPQRKVGSPAV
jgi:hypothetical protein